MLPVVVVLWERPPVHCTLRVLDDEAEPFEVTVYRDAAVILQRRFAINADAAEFAIAQMHAADAG